ncbi:MAG: TetR family transcriptional regulator [Nonomuraea muscovyensis]|jgi:AcrR family transcriptional regulator|uniref:AcrR family transcriptional regulator n=1 Tax=Nonomuraea muscovyensis TaxID=1124761 RepID=A0A7X0F1N4_9ACTN|nr:TetR/AcrR family transcriptional regulator [Nonomuraea muscovyensis]MBB6349759.1 AcrR family transcriptional regulator [Nonomuraea muscovyensis]MDF2705299.1 TetR family transcriptional regulator [Nonomuraea muscovyensis]
MQKRVRARRGHGPLLREEILRAAAALLAETGTEDALTLRAVAERTGVSTPSVYLHFADKEALVEAVCLRVWDELGRLFAACGDDDPLRTLGRCGRAYARFALDHPVQYRVLMMRPPAGRAGVAGVPRAAAACFGHMVDAVAACVRTGVLRGDPELLALGMWSAVHGCVSLFIAQPSFPWPGDREALVDHIVRVAGFGTALAARLPRELPPSAELARELDDLATRLAAREEPPGPA